MTSGYAALRRRWREALGDDMTLRVHEAGLLERASARGNPLKTVPHGFDAAERGICIMCWSSVVVHAPSLFPNAYFLRFFPFYPDVQPYVLSIWRVPTSLWRTLCIWRAPRTFLPPSSFLLLPSCLSLDHPDTSIPAASKIGAN